MVNCNQIQNFIHSIHLTVVKSILKNKFIVRPIVLVPSWLYTTYLHQRRLVITLSWDMKECKTARVDIDMRRHHHNLWYWEYQMSTRGVTTTGVILGHPPSAGSAKALSHAAASVSRDRGGVWVNGAPSTVLT